MELEEWPVNTVPDGYHAIPACPFVYETEVDGQRVRLEAPTHDGLMAIMREIRPVMLYPAEE